MQPTLSILPHRFYCVLEEMHYSSRGGASKKPPIWEAFGSSVYLDAMLWLSQARIPPEPGG